MDLRARIGPWAASLLVVACTAIAAGGIASTPAMAAVGYQAQWGDAGAGDSQLSLPTGLDVDELDNVYVADYGNNRIQKFTPDGELLTAWGSTGTSGGH